MLKIKIMAVLGAAALGAILIFGFGNADSLQAEKQIMHLNCLECHTCPNPTNEDVCLKPCPSLTWAQSASKHKVTEAPDSMLLDKLVKQYSAVHFNHKIHAQMSDMNKGCETCHHYSPPGQIPPCSKCHGGEANPANLGQPSLKGAYHRQCLSCHREWSHDTKCIICHNPISGQSLLSTGHDTTDIMGISHPIITVPSKRTYFTPYKTGPVVTFYHQEHIDLFGQRCVDCHQKENCSFCHDLYKPARLKKSQEEVHAVCSGCHKTDKCDKCHDKKEKPAFTHAATGWPLNRYHKALDCRACHPTGKKIAWLDTSCKSCHSGWNRDNFEHALTGLQLDDVHHELDCGDCHENLNFAARPNCSGCHDDGRTPAQKPPGTYIKISQR